MTHTETISISYSLIRSKVLTALSVLGKRNPSKDQPAFTTIQVSTAEEPLLSQYIKNAAHNVLSRIPKLIHNLTEDDETVKFDITNTRWDTAQQDSFASSFSFSVIGFCVAAATSDYLALVLPEQAKAYAANAESIMRDIISLCYYKQPSESSSNYLTAISTSVS